METKNDFNEMKFKFLKPCQPYEGIQDELIEFLNHIEFERIEKVCFGKEKKCEYFKNHEWKLYIVKEAIKNLKKLEQFDRIKLFFWKNNLRKIFIPEVDTRTYFFVIFLKIKKNKK